MSGRPASIALLAAGAALFAAGCGGGGATEPAEAPVTISQSTPPDHLDPALAATPAAREPLWLVYTPLLTYRHASGERGAELIPGLASDLPEVSDDGLTYTLELREGLEYSDGTPVRAADFEHAIDRVRGLDSPGAVLYDRIAAIETSEQSRRITISLSDPDPDFADALALTYAAPVPQRTPVRDLSDDPPPGVGPYEITRVDPRGGFVLARGGGFDELDIPDIPTGNVDQITTKIVPGAARQAQDVLDGKLDYMQARPPAQLEATIGEQASDRFADRPMPATVYAWFDLDRPPFDDPRVREAVAAGIDRGAIGRALGGSLAPGCAFLAPGVPGYDESLDTGDCPFGDPSAPPDRAGARELIDRAGAEGARVTVAVVDRDRRAANAYAGELKAIGLRAAIDDTGGGQTSLRTVAPTFPRAADFFSWLDPEPPAATAVAALEPTPALDSDSDRWRALDQELISPPQAQVAVVGHPQVATFFSERMDPAGTVFSPVYRNDYSSWQLKEGE